MRTIVIGDVHGCLAELEELLCVVGDRVHLNEGGDYSYFSKLSGKTVEVREIAVRGSEAANRGGQAGGHYVDVDFKLSLSDDRGCSVWRISMWLEKAQ
jgi:hypothetical protein